MQNQIETMTEGANRVDARLRCAGEGLDDGDETLARDGATGEYYWVCLFCRGVVRPARHAGA